MCHGQWLWLGVRLGNSVMLMMKAGQAITATIALVRVHTQWRHSDTLRRMWCGGCLCVSAGNGHGHGPLTFSLDSFAAFSWRTRSPCTLIWSRICSRVSLIFRSRGRKKHNKLTTILASGGRWARGLSIWFAFLWFLWFSRFSCDLPQPQLLFCCQKNYTRCSVEVEKHRC